jgi:hypothetical protein
MFGYFKENQMKKVALSLLALAVFSALAFADDVKPAITWGAWGRGFFNAVVTGGKDGTGAANTQTGLATSWGGQPRVGWSLLGNSANVGFEIDGNFDYNAAGATSFGLSDQEKIWVKPIDGLTLTIGRAYDDTLRGNISYGSWNWIRINGVSDEDNTFVRVDTGRGGAGTGGFLASYGVGDFYIYAAENSIIPAADLQTTFKRTQEGFGYTIKDIGTIRAQLVGSAKGDSVLATGGWGGAAASDLQVINAAFKVVAVKNLYVDVGAFIPTTSDAGYQAIVNAYANYTIDKATIHASVGYLSPKTGDAPIKGGVGLDYGFDGGIGLNADVRYTSKTASGVQDANTSFLLGVTKGFSNGLVGIGIQYSTYATMATWGGDIQNQAPRVTTAC